MDEDQIYLSLHAAKALLALIEFKKDCSSFTEEIVKFINACLNFQYQIYEREFINVSAEDRFFEEDIGYDSEGGVITQNSLTSQLIECLIAMINYEEYELFENIQVIIEFAMKF